MNDQACTVDSAQFRILNESPNANTEDDRSGHGDALYRTCSPFEFFAASDIETHPESHSKTFAIPVFERIEQETIQRSLYVNPAQTHTERTVAETENDLVSILGLSSFVSSNITLQRAISESSLVNRNMIQYTDLPWVILQYILKQNLRWRDSILPELQLQNTNTTAEQPDIEYTPLLTIGNILSTESILDSADQCIIHPLDIFVTTFSCCSNELKVIICQKLFMCKQAIPLIYPIPGRARPCFTSLPLYSLVMECRTSEKNADVIDAASAKTKIIGFLRIGSISQSKSSLLNGILNADKHSPFCHRDNLLNQTKPLGMKGLIEATWFLPSGKKTDYFKEVITFLNLRGDAQYVKPEFRSFLWMCSTIVAMVDVSHINDKKIIDVLDQVQQPTSTLLLGLIDNEDERAYPKLKADLQSLPAALKSLPLLVNFDQKGKIKPTATLLSEIRKGITSVSKNNEKRCLIECGRGMSRQGYVILDEDLSNSCTEGQMMAKRLYMKLCGRAVQMVDTLQIEEMPCASMRDTCLSLQGKVWKKISELTKKQFKAGDLLCDKDRIECNVETIRRQQLHLCTQLQPVLEMFVQFLLSSSADDELCKSFIMWLKILLDANTRRRLPDLFRKLRTGEIEIRRAREKKLDKISIQELEKSLESTALKIDKASFGLEHFIRELGQVYECVMVFKQECERKTLCGINMIPEIVAKLLLKGEALEILDGDTANVPLQWIQDVFRCLQDNLGDRKLFIVSVLGLQSSGKSTLLNTMFGLQFKVSAGRCTRGVFAHLVCLEDQTDLPYEYILVIDTEGLQGKGRETDKHDNELATFVIGMGDVTLVNVKGENTAELTDVLQIAVHAFLRMTLTNKSIEIKRKCIFIHQNVGALDAKEKLTPNLMSFLDELDRLTLIAAREENIYDVTHFNQVVDFQLQKHVLYFPDLWSGDPPMAPCNSGYSERVCETLKILLDAAKDMGSFITVTDLVRRIEDLWKGIMTEDFVFCFQNSLEIKIYNSMDTEYHKLAGCFSQTLMEWLEWASYELENCRTTEALTGCHEKLRQELNEFVREKAEYTQAKLIDYFDNSSMHLTLKQWKNQRILNFNELADEFHSNLRTQICEKAEGKRLEFVQMDLQTIIIAKAKQLAADLQGKKPTDEEIETEFNRVWPCWINELFKSRLPIDDESIETTVLKCLYERNIKDTIHMTSEEIRKHLSTPLDCTDLQSSWSDTGFDKSDLQVEISLKPYTYGNQSESELRKQALSKIYNLFGELDVHFKNLIGKGVQFHKQHATQVIDKVLDYFANVEAGMRFAFSPSYKIKVAVHVCRFAISQFMQMNITYREKQIERTKIENYKNTTKHFFINSVKQEIAEVVAADFFYNCLKSSAVKSVRVSLPRKISHEISVLFGNRKHTLLLTMMEDLAMKRQYDLYSAYLNDPFRFAYSWIKNYVNESFFKNSQDRNSSNFMIFVKERLMQMIVGINLGIDKATKHVMEGADTRKSIIDWLHFFQEHILPYLTVSPESYEQVADQGAVEMLNFQVKVREKLCNFQQEIIEEFDEDEFNTFCGKIYVDYENIFKTLWGCEEQCPFCGEPCYRSAGHLKDGMKHACIQHRPIGVSGTVYGEKDNRLILESCSFQVQARKAEFTCMACSGKCNVAGKCSPNSIMSHKFKCYRTHFPDWEIPPCTTMDKSKYWIWVLKTFKTDMAEEHGVPIPKIPKSWGSITYKEAMKSLRD